MKCDHRGYEVMYAKERRGGRIVRRKWKCAYCNRRIKGPLPPTRSMKIVREFKGGLSRVGLARKYGVTMDQVDRAIRKALP